MQTSQTVLPGAGAPAARKLIQILAISPSALIEELSKGFGRAEMLPGSMQRVAICGIFLLPSACCSLVLATGKRSLKTGF